MRFRAFCGAAAAVLCACGAWAQNPRGALRGTVEDTSGARVPSAKVVLDAASVLRRETTTDERGEFRLEDLPAGAYHVVVSTRGFADALAEVNVALGSVREVAVTLKPAAASQTVSVKDGASSITTQPMDTESV